VKQNKKRHKRATHRYA